MSLKYRADQRTLAFISTYFILLGVSFVMPLNGLTGAVMLALLCYFSFVCAVITHNTIHAPMFESQEVNRLLQLVLTLTYGHPVSAFVPGHNLSHHRYTQTDRDLMRTSKVRFGWNLLNQLLFSWTVGPAIFGANLRFARIMRKSRPVWFRQFVLEVVAWLAFVLASLALDPLRSLLFVLVPHQYAAWGIMGINFVQHDGCDRASKYNHSRNFVGRWVNLLTFNNGYHGIHHMRPSLHWSLLPAAHAKELAPHIHPNLDQPNFPLYLWRSFISPGVRLTYDGRPHRPPPAGPDVDWIPEARPLPREDLGAAPGTPARLRTRSVGELNTRTEVSGQAR